MPYKAYGLLGRIIPRWRSTLIVSTTQVRNVLAQKLIYAASRSTNFDAVFFLPRAGEVFWMSAHADRCYLVCLSLWKEILTRYFQSHMPSDVVCLSVYGKEILTRYFQSRAMLSVCPWEEISTRYFQSHAERCCSSACLSMEKRSRRDISKAYAERCCLPACLSGLSMGRNIDEIFFPKPQHPSCNRFAWLWYPALVLKKKRLWRSIHTRGGCVCLSYVFILCVYLVCLSSVLPTVKERCVSRRGACDYFSALRMRAFSRQGAVRVLILQNKVEYSISGRRHLDQIHFFQKI